MKKTIALAGPKHTGKTSAGKALAALLPGVFFDLDDEIRQSTGKTARELYIEGKDSFQAAERDALAGVFEKTDASADNGWAVIALGGGFIDNQAALALLQARPCRVVVYLALSAETAWRRIEASAAADGSLPAFLRTDNPRVTHREIHRRRAAAYQKIASFTINTGHTTVAETAAAIAAALEGKAWENSTP
jgi:shikimate kinase